MAVSVGAEVVMIRWWALLALMLLAVSVMVVEAGTVLAVRAPMAEPESLPDACAGPVFFSGIIQPGETVEHQFLATCADQELRMIYQWPYHPFYTGNAADKVLMTASYEDPTGAGQWTRTGETWQDVIQFGCTWWGGDGGVQTWRLHHDRGNGGPQHYIGYALTGEWAKVPLAGRPAVMPDFCGPKAALLALTTWGR